MMNKKLRIRVRAIPARFLVDQSPQKPNRKSMLDSIRELIGVITAGTGIFAVLLYLAGRSFASGYFSAMNIPSFQVNFSLWEYGEVGWTPLLVYPLGIFAASGLFWGIIYVLRDWLTPLIKQMIKWIIQLLLWFKKLITQFITKYVKIRLSLPTIKFSPISREARISFRILGASFYLFILLTFISVTLNFVTQWGKNNGEFFILNNSPQVELVSSNPIPLDDANIISPQAGTDGLYIYQGFHLLTFNNGKHYLFKEIDWATCKPTKVYIVNANENIQVNLLPPVSLADQCQKTINPTATATPIATQLSP